MYLVVGNVKPTKAQIKWDNCFTNIQFFTYKNVLFTNKCCFYTDNYVFL